MDDVQALAKLVIELGRAAAGAERSDALLPLLAEAAVGHVGADAAAVFEIVDGDKLVVVASSGLPERARFFEVERDVDLGEALRKECGRSHAMALTFPLVSDQDRFGSLVLLYRRGHEPSEEARLVTEALVALAAMTLGRAQAPTYELSALGQLAAGISHDLKNILNPLKIHLQVLERVVPQENAAAHHSVREMLDVIASGVATIDRLRDLSRQEPITAVVDVDAVVGQAPTED